MSRRRKCVALGAVLLAGIAAAWAWREITAGRDAEPGARPSTGRKIFRDVAEEAGIDFRMQFLPGEQGEHFKVNLYDHGCGVVVGDYNGDDRDDILFLNQMGANALYRNNGDGTFTDVTEEAGDVGLADRICVGGAFADYDNDGDQDLYITSTRGGNVLFQNQGPNPGTPGAGKPSSGPRFRDATREAGVECVAHSQTPVFFDADNDGDLDLLVTNTAKWTTDKFADDGKYYPGVGDLAQIAASPIEHNVFFRNNGRGAFDDATREQRLEGPGWSGDAAVCDFDEDGDSDLLITNMFGRSRLYRNDGPDGFRDAALELLGVTSWGAIGAKWLDFNNDGRLDLFVTDMHSDMWAPTNADLSDVDGGKKHRYASGSNSEMEAIMADVFGIRYDEVVFGNTLFESVSPGRFREVSDRAGAESFWPWGIATGDFDNDGWEDAYVPAGMGYPWPYWPNSLLMNQGNGTFADRAHDAGVEPPRHGTLLETPIAGRQPPRSSRCAATADFDGDGRLEIVVNNFNDRPYFFQNAFPKRNHAAFRLQGTRSNRDAVGAVVRLHVGDRIMTRQVQAAGGYLSQSSKTLHFGLGDATRVDRCEIVWPSGLRQELATVKINGLQVVVEPRDIEPRDGARRAPEKGVR